MNFILDKIIKLNTLQIVGVFRKEDTDYYYLLKTRKKEARLDVTGLGSYADFDELKKNIDAKTPIILVLDGKGVLNKKIDQKNETDVNWLKNLDYSSIYHTTYSNAGYRLLGFCRRNVAEDSIALFQKEGFEVMDFYIGPLMAILLKDTLKKDRFVSNDTVLEFDSDEFTDLFKSKDDNINTYDIGKTTLSSYHLPLYGAAIHFYIRQRSIDKSVSQAINKEEIIYKKAFNVFGLGMIAGFFILLFASYLLTGYYNTENAELNLKNVYSNESFKLIEDLEKQRENKLRILNETGFSSSKFISFYSYELSKSAPSGIRLGALEVFPVEKEIKSNDKVNFTTKTISLKGSTYNESEFDSWIKSLKTIEWISNFEIVSLKKDKKNCSHFELKIIIKNV